ncbi:uncharacterized protein BXZ73DRAFT_52673 [Epithele typhae]|uniref:uncharacterized protein n=1 Tax=Epithele typhae TaxID=378194 RepID=UPI002007E82F|nr:uncharacterized protein BXZ73DRAFT_52673 [Epithele typhae]KAH9918923.1 hypothetical protein BXZ73DRAFT_52673 [Epithele typhae]
MTSTSSTTRTLPTPPLAPSYSARSPSKKDPSLKPNPHPYAIKTTSTGILTRSNSSGYNVNASHHYYIPPSPTHHRSDSKGHRATKSLTLVPESPSRESPRPLPIPPDLDHTVNRRDGSGSSSGYVSADEVSRQAPRRPKRAETLPVFPLPTPALPAPPSADDLPDNPKLWTPSQLATYLVTALRMTSNGKPGEIESIGLPTMVAKDIATFVKGARIGGRTFLRLTEEDLEQLGMNKKWRTALLAAARNLRQNVLKGRIWGGADSPGGSPSPESTSPESAPSKIFSSAEFNSSSSSIESSSSFDGADGEEGDPDAPKGSVLLGRSKARRYRAGRVRGMVNTFERSGSFSSDGGPEDDGVAPATNVGLGTRLSVIEERSHFRTWGRQAPPPPGLRASESPSPSRGRPLPAPPARGDDEPSMEDLLAQLGAPMTGAEAWEAVDIAAGVTVKHVPDQAQRYSSTPSSPSRATASIAPLFDTGSQVAGSQVGVQTLAGLGNGRGSGGSSKGRNERRVVTAIFAPTASSPNKRPLPVPPQSQPQPQPRREASGGSEASAPAPAPVPDPELEAERMMEQVRLERMLEEEILTTRALLETFRARLEHVEEKVSELETRDDAREAALELARVRVAEAEAEAEAARASLEKGKGRASDTEPLAPSVDVGVSTWAQIEVEKADDDEAMEEGDSSTGSSTMTIAPPPAAPAPAPASALASSSSSTLQSVVRGLYAPATLLSTSPRELIRRSKRTARQTASGTDEYEYADEGPASVSDLPSYVFLVGLGVCAVVAQVMLRKFVGKGGLRP